MQFERAHRRSSRPLGRSCICMSGRPNGQAEPIKEAKRQNAQSALSAVLRTHSRRHDRPGAVASYGDFNPAYRDRIEAYRLRALRAPETWRCGIKSRGEDKRFIDLVRLTFARYRVPAHLETSGSTISTTISSIKVACSDPPRRHASPGGRTCALVHRGRARRLALSGRRASLLSKREVHHFLTAPDEVTSRQAGDLVRGCARADGRARAARSRSRRRAAATFRSARPSGRRSRASSPAIPISIQDMDDLIDFLLVAKQEDDAFSLQGPHARRAAPAHGGLASRAAHAAECRRRCLARATDPRRRLRDRRDHDRAIWRFRQIKTGNELFREGQRMHHCVATYKSALRSGD